MTDEQIHALAEFLHDELPPSPKVVDYVMTVREFLARQPPPADRKAQWAKEREEQDTERAWEISPEWNAYVTHIRTEVAPAMAESALSATLMPKDPSQVDVKLAVETGLAFMFDKPMVFIVPDGATVPEKMRRVADAIVVGDPSDERVRDEFMSAMQRVMGDS